MYTYHIHYIPLYMWFIHLWKLSHIRRNAINYYNPNLISISGKQDAFQPVSNCGPEIIVFQFPTYLDNF